MSDYNYISHKDIDLATKYTVGGKAKNLYKMQQIQLNVPEWIVIPDETFRTVLYDDHFSSKPDDIYASIMSIEIPDEFIDSICNLLDKSEYFAVRSSAADEDGSEFSYAGLFESFLYIRKQDLAEAIKKVWLSVFSERVKAYRKEKNIDYTCSMAVIIQRMVYADVSGVAFGINPVSGNRNEKVINAVFGLGEGLVSGQLNSDSFIVKGEGITANIVDKLHKITCNSNQQSGTIQVEISEKDQDSSTLTDTQLLEISEVLDKLYFETNKYQDIEFAYEDNKLYLLQTRPITNLSKLPDIENNYIVWDNSNIIESYPDVTSPLTFSFITYVYERAYKQLLALFGVNKHEIEENNRHFMNLLGSIRGRVYYNLRGWYKLLSLLPGYSLNTGFMEKMMGVKERFVLDDIKKHSKFSDYRRVVGMIINMLRNLRSLPKQTRYFKNLFETVNDQFSKLNYNKFNAYELMDTFKKYENQILKHWKAPLVNDFFAMIYFGMLQKSTQKYQDADKNIHNDLLCGSEDIVSTQPAILIVNITKQIKDNEKARKLFTENSASDIWNKLQNSDYKLVSEGIEGYINKFGDRYVGELKLETVTYKQNPVAFIEIIKSYVEANLTHTTDSNYSQTLRTTAEATMNKCLKGKLLKKWIFRYILKTTRRLVSNRENLRYYRTKAFGTVRQIFIAIGKQFYAEGLIAEQRDIFYLTIEEIFNYIEGKSVNLNLKKLIEYRKSEYDIYKNEKPLAERIKTYGIVYQGNDFDDKIERAIENADLQGIGCCKGIVTAKARVISSPTEVANLKGDILVTSSTDPGWVTLFPSTSGILVERGSLLSHSAIVSREMGIPCVVGISGLLQSVKTGDIIEMDGGSGKVRIVKS